MDEGITELLPVLASPAFANFNHLNVTATRMTQLCAQPFIEFMSTQFPEGKRLVIELRLNNIRKTDYKSKVDPVKEFRKSLNTARKARPHSNFILKF